MLRRDKETIPERPQSAQIDPVRHFKSLAPLLLRDAKEHGSRRWIVFFVLVFFQGFGATGTGP